jgi:hypothetical protein
MSVRGQLDVPDLPVPLRFDDDGDVVASLARKKVHLTALHLPEPRLSVLSALPVSRTPHVVIAPHLSARAREAVQARGWGWIEATGNAHIQTDQLFIHVERPVRSANVANRGRSIPPQGERIVRHLLDSYPAAHRFTEIARATNLDKGYTSRILRRLAENMLIRYERNKPVELTSPTELFEFWQTIPPRTVESSWFVSRATSLRQLALRVTEMASGLGGSAFTGVFGANLLVAHLEPERIDCYVSDVRTASRLGEDLRAEPVSRGSNLVLLVHRDPGVFTIGTRRVRDLRVVAPSQLYRDALLRGRGREREAANELRRVLMKW